MEKNSQSGLGMNGRGFCPKRIARPRGSSMPRASRNASWSRASSVAAEYASLRSSGIAGTVRSCMIVRSLWGLDASKYALGLKGRCAQLAGRTSCREMVAPATNEPRTEVPEPPPDLPPLEPEGPPEEQPEPDKAPEPPREPEEEPVPA